MGRGRDAVSTGRTRTFRQASRSGDGLRLNRLGHRGQRRIDLGYLAGRWDRSLKYHPHASISRQSWSAPPVTLPRWKELPLYRAPTDRSMMVVGWGSRLALSAYAEAAEPPFSAGNLTPHISPRLGRLQFPAALVMQGQGPNDHHGQRQHDCNVHQLPATASPVPSMPEVVVNGSNFVRQVIIRLPNLASADTCIEVCHGDLPQRRRTRELIQ